MPGLPRFYNKTITPTIAASSPPAAEFTFRLPTPLPLALVAVVVAADTPGAPPPFDDGGAVVDGDAVNGDVVPEVVVEDDFTDVCVEFPAVGVPVGVYLTPEKFVQLVALAVALPVMTPGAITVVGVK